MDELLWTIFKPERLSIAKWNAKSPRIFGLFHSPTGYAKLVLELQFTQKLRARNIAPEKLSIHHNRLYDFLRRFVQELGGLES